MQRQHKHVLTVLVVGSAFSARGETEDPTCIEKCEYHLPPGVGQACEDQARCGGCARCQPGAVLCEPANGDDISVLACEGWCAVAYDADHCAACKCKACSSCGAEALAAAALRGAGPRGGRR